MSRQIPYLQRRGDALSFRISVPPDLRSIIGTREFVKALSTQDRRIATPIALSWAARAKQLFINLRCDMAKHKTPINPNGFDYTVEVYIEGLGSFKGSGEPQEQIAIDSSIKTAMESAAEMRQKTPGIPTTSIKPEHSPVDPVCGPVPSFYQVVDKYLEDYLKTKYPAMYKKHMTVLPMLRDFIGDIPVTNLRQSNINDFFTLLQQLPPRWKDQCRAMKLTVRELAEIDHIEKIGPKTFDDTYRASIRPFLDDAVTNWQDRGFPTTISIKSIKYKGDREEGEKMQRAFKPSELKQLFEGDRMKQFAADPKQDHCYWLPHVGLYTGARVNEVCQLNPQTDILQDDETGIWFFLITNDTEGDERIIKSTKNDESKRKVPIHSKLIELGFLRYSEKVRKTGAKLLFPSWKPSRGKASGEAEKWFRQLIVDTNLRDETKGARIVGFHAFRHTLENKGENTKGLPWPIEHITGHTIPGKSKVARGYSGELELKNKKEILEAVSFDVKFHLTTTASDASPIFF